MSDATSTSSERAQGELPTGAEVSPAAAAAAAEDWVARFLPATWRRAAHSGGPVSVRAVRTPDEYRAWYPVFGRSGLVVPTWAVAYGGLGWKRETAAAVDKVLGPYHLPRLNPLGLNLATPVLFAYGTEAQRRRFLPPIVRAEEIWCQLFSEPGAGSDLAALATTARKADNGWVITGQKIWTTWADQADFAVLLARTNPALPKHQGITYFLFNMRQQGVTVRPLLHLTGETEFFQCFIDDAYVPDEQRVGEVGDGWRVAQATLGGERQMVAGAGSGGVDRIGGGSVAHLVRLARRRSADGLDQGWADTEVRHRITRLWCEERVRAWTNERIRARLASGRPPGPESSVGKVHGADLNQRVQEMAAELLGVGEITWPGTAGDPDDYARSLPAEVKALLRSRANSIEGGTTEVNKTLIAERVLGLPKEVDPWRGKPWNELPRG